MRRVVFSLLFALCGILISAEYHCVWYGQCGTSGILPRTCVAKDITARSINDTEAEDILQKKCPHFFENGGLYILINHLRNSFVRRND